MVDEVRSEELNSFANETQDEFSVSLYFYVEKSAAQCATLQSSNEFFCVQQ